MEAWVTAWLEQIVQRIDDAVTDCGRARAAEEARDSIKELLARPS